MNIFGRAGFDLTRSTTAPCEPATETFVQSVNVVHGAPEQYDLVDLTPLIESAEVRIAESVASPGRTLW